MCICSILENTNLGVEDGERKLIMLILVVFDYDMMNYLPPPFDKDATFAKTSMYYCSINSQRYS